MKAIHKYQLEYRPLQVLRMPDCSKILHVGAQNDRIYLWAIVDTDREPYADTRHIHILGTGQDWPDDLPSHGEYLGSVQTSRYIWHIFQEEVHK